MVCANCVCQWRSSSALYRGIQTKRALVHHSTTLMVSLRGAKRRGALSREARGSALGVQSRAGSYDFVDSFPRFNRMLRDHRVLLGPCNDKSDGLSHRICTAKNLRLPLQRAYCPFPERSFSLRCLLSLFLFEPAFSLPYGGAKRRDDKERQCGSPKNKIEHQTYPGTVLEGRNTGRFRIEFFLSAGYRKEGQNSPLENAGPSDVGACDRLSMTKCCRLSSSDENGDLASSEETATFVSSCSVRT